MQKIIVYAILALRRFLILSNQHHFNERGDGTDKKVKSTLTVVGTGSGVCSMASLCIIKIPFENLFMLSVFFYHLSSISRYLMKNSLSSIVKLRKVSFFELKFSVKSVH